jgi:hypothetical protein
MRKSGQSGQREAGRKAAHVSEFLIANLELEFHVSPIRISKLKFSNRKFSAISWLERAGCIPSIGFDEQSVQLALAHSREPLLARAAGRWPRVADFSSSPQPQASSFQNLIETPRLEFLATRTKQRSQSFSNRDKMSLLHPGCINWNHVFVPPPATRHGSLVTSSSCIVPPSCLTWRLPIGFAQDGARQNARDEALQKMSRTRNVNALRDL